MSTPGCSDDVCVTCSDTATPATVLSLLDDEMALVRFEDGEREVSVALVTADVGDRVLVHAGEAISVLPGGAA
ncbi:hydrogenase expression/formation protein HypC [Lentzea waywayandensis]|uniref:Hydrogenase expression/formation protein HypC n=1 Tax=Lentzea waywayandensis TaxID=84724 RepID=A0A1I6DAM5_9PSEU|nr:HypC/HybG/HupF family hydrogenase formation chaperone [Lentzea waywayandensis]SFR02503.1 hydrogenase expression/formation protein HypC [Lentzea waywayandensis]